MAQTNTITKYIAITRLRRIRFFIRLNINGNLSYIQHIESAKGFTPAQYAPIRVSGAKYTTKYISLINYLHFLTIKNKHLFEHGQ